MNKKSQYFKDLEILFNKAKKEENIVVPKKSKDEIRLMLEHKAQQMKAGDVEEPLINRFSDFWNKWRYQIVGLPASAFMLFVVVYAATNMQFTMPKEDFSPKTEIVFEEPAEEDVELVEVEEDEPKLIRLPRLKIEYKDEEPKEVRVLKDKIINRYYVDFNEQEEVKDFEAYVNFVDPEMMEDVNEFTFQIPADEVFPEEEEEETTATQTTTEKPAEQEIQNPVVKTGGAPSNETEDDTSEDEVNETTSTDSTLDNQTDSQAPVNDNVATTQEPQQEEVASTPAEEPAIAKTVTDIDNNITLEKRTYESIKEKLISEQDSSVFEEFEVKDFTKNKLNFEVQTYVKEGIKNPEKFNDDLISGLSSSEVMDYIKIYYTTETDAIIEVKENGTTKWYIFTYKDDKWSFLEYQKTATKINAVMLK